MLNIKFGYEKIILWGRSMGAATALLVAMESKVLSLLYF